MSGDPGSFADAENWTGGFYELAVELGDRDDQRLDAAIGAAWADPRLTGPFAARSREPSTQERVTPSLATHTATDHLHGLAELPIGRRVVCGSVIIREEGPTFRTSRALFRAISVASPRLARRG